MPIYELKQQPVQPGEEIVVEVDDIHESGAGVGVPTTASSSSSTACSPARAEVRIHRVKSSHATAQDVVERLPDDPEEGEGDDGDGDDPAGDDVDDADDTEEDDGKGDRRRDRPDRERLGSRENFWGK